jgi:actin cytoskeleton-regulatory complex protein PAN1
VSIEHFIFLGCVLIVASTELSTNLEHRVRTLYPYESTRPEELCVFDIILSIPAVLISVPAFKEDVIILAHPSKSGSDWWYGRSMADQSAGFFPKTYAQALENGAINPHQTWRNSLADSCLRSQSCCAIPVHSNKPR